MLHNVKKAIVFGYFVYNKTITFDYIHILYVERGTRRYGTRKTSVLRRFSWTKARS